MTSKVADLHFATGVLEYYGEEEDVRVTTIMNIDFMLDVVPARLINFFSKMFAYYMFKRICKNLESELHKEIIEEKEMLYSYFRKRLEIVH